MSGIKLQRRGFLLSLGESRLSTSIPNRTLLVIPAALLYAIRGSRVMEAARRHSHDADDDYDGKVSSYPYLVIPPQVILLQPSAYSSASLQILLAARCRSILPRGWIFWQIENWWIFRSSSSRGHVLPTLRAIVRAESFRVSNVETRNNEIG